MLFQNIITYYLILVLGTILPVLIAVAFFTLAERKIMAFVQRRRGPDVVGFWGLLQPIADALKLIIAEPIILSNSSPYLFLLAPLIPLIFGLTSWAIIPLGYTESHNMSSINLLYLFPLSIGGVYGIILAGWASNSKYSIIGSFRSVAQMLSYDIPLMLALIPIIILAGSANLTEIVLVQDKSCWFAIPLLPLVIIFFITMLAETNRAPFDLPEAEAELVAGFNVEYASVIFAFFFLGEYSNMILMSVLITLLFFGGFGSSFVFNVSSINFTDLLSYSLINKLYYIFWIFSFFGFGLASLQLFFCINPIFFFFFKVSIICFFFVLVRANFPRYRYDQLMHLGWKILLPLTLSMVIFTTGIFFTLNGFTNSFSF